MLLKVTLEEGVWQKECKEIQFCAELKPVIFIEKAERHAILHVKGLLHNHSSRSMLLLPITQSHAIGH